MCHQLETMHPDRIRAEKERAPYIYIPVGAIEWHGHHNVTGLDALKAHRQLLRVAGEAGGLVYPPIFTGTFCDRDYADTFMISQGTLINMLEDLLVGFEKEGFKKAVLLCGHYPNFHFAAAPLAKRWNAGSREMKVLTLVENQLPGIAGDHGGMGETSCMLDLMPDTVDLKRIGDREQAVGTGTDQNNWIATPLDHPCHGVVGADPRLSTCEEGERINQKVVAAISGWIKTEEIEVEWSG